MNKIDAKFKQLKKKNKKAFIAFITAGYPDLKTTKALVKELEKRGVDIIELGVPFSDPLADGPVIQEASSAALRKGATLARILTLVKELRKEGVRVPLCLMTYYNPVFKFGDERFMKTASQSGVDGLIIPDLPPEEGKGLLDSARKNGIDVILFIAPTTTRERARFISKRARGFIYYVSLTGVTGTRDALPADLVKNLTSLRTITDKPVCVGFGIARPEHLAPVYAHAEGAIVGSAIVRAIQQNLGKNDLVFAVGNFVSKFIARSA